MKLGIYDVLLLLKAVVINELIDNAKLIHTTYGMKPGKPHIIVSVFDHIYHSGLEEKKW